MATLTPNRVIGYCLALGLLASVGLVGSAHTEAEHQDGVRRRQEQARRAVGLSAAAAITGRYVGTVAIENVGGPATLEELVNISSTIVVGWTTGNVSRLTQDGKSIFLVYDLQVESVLRGSPVPVLQFAVPGGRVTFPDGTSAQLNPVGFRLPQNGNRYLLFLRQEPLIFDQTLSTGPAVRFQPAAGPLGVYRLSNSESVTAAGNYRSPLSRWLMVRRFGPESFLTVVREALR